jgi:N,N'-diacetyllegionaminate synthase
LIIILDDISTLITKTINYDKNLLECLKIGKREIGKDGHVFIIAEAGVNYNNKLSLAYKMIDQASKAGADAIKFQTFIADEIQLKNSTNPKYFKNKKGKKFNNIVENLQPSFEDQEKLIKYCKQKNILFLSTPYDKTSVDFLKKIGIKAFKISSSDTTNHQFLEYVAKNRMPIILSTGMSESIHVDQAVKLLKSKGMKNNLILLQATSDYPTPNEDVNIRVITTFQKKYKIPIGLSDHTSDFVASLGAVALGASVVEKHFTLSRTLSGPDQAASLEPHELTEWIAKIRLMEKSLGSKTKFVTKSEKENLSMRKILVVKPIKKGTKITKDMLLTLRGNDKGILPLNSNIKKIVGKKIKKDIRSKKQFSWNMV